MRSVARLLFALMSVVTGTAAAAVGSAREPQTPLPLITVGRTAIAPDIDGRISESEWRHAAKTTGFLDLAQGTAADLQTTWYLTYDEQRLYAAFECELPAEGLPKSSETRRDGSVGTDDSVEMLLQPQDAAEGDVYHFIGNSLGTIHDEFRRETAWNGRWQFRTHSSRGGWSGEFSIPWEDLGTRPPDGQTWRANFCRSVGKFTAWADSGRGYVASPQCYGHVRFVSGDLLMQVGPITGLERGETRVALRAVNTAKTANRAVVGVRSRTLLAAQHKELSRVNTPEWHSVRQCSLAAGTSNDLAVSVAPPKEGLRRLEISVVDETDREIYRQAIPYNSAGVPFVKFLADPSEEKVFIRVDLRGRNGKLPVEVQLDLQHLQEGWRLPLRYSDLILGKVRTFREDIRSWPLGTVRVHARLLSAEGESRQEELDLSYERMTAPEWYLQGRSVGVSRNVLKPWTPIQWDGRRLKVWGRQHDLTDSLFVRQIISDGEPLLAGPVSLEATVGDKPCQATVQRRESAAADPDQVVVRSEGSLGPIPLQLTTTAEYDGMFKCELQFQPPGEVPVRGLRLVIPLLANRALYYHLASSYYNKGEAGAIPPEGLQLPFIPFVWVGDDRRGLTWFAESTQGWRPSPEPIRLERDPQAGVVRMIVEFVAAHPLRGSRKLVFGLQATPVKPVAPDWRAWRTDYIWPPRAGRSVEIDWKSLGVPIQWRLLWWTDGPKRVFSEGYTAPLQILPSLAKHVEQAHREGEGLTPYTYLHGVSDCAIGFERYYPLWQTSNPREIAGLGDVLHGACPSGVFGDYLLYGFQQMVRKYGIDGLYFDGGGPPVPCANELHGHGWIDEFGARQPSYPIFGLRRFFKRLQTLLQEQVPRPVIWVHSDGKMASPVYSFVTATWEGEMVQGALRRGDTFLSDLLSLEFCRAHQLATQWGVVVMWLPSNYGTAEQKAAQARDAMALVLVHGTPVGRVGSFDRDLLQAVWKAQADFGIDQAEFYGYWENAERVQLAPEHPRVKASLYERGTRKMLVVSNFTTETQAMQVRLRDAGTSAVLRDVLSNEQFSAADGRFAFTIPPKSFRLLVGE